MKFHPLQVEEHGSKCHIALTTPNQHIVIPTGKDGWENTQALARLLAHAPLTIDALRAVHHEYDQQYDGTSDLIHIPAHVAEKVFAAIAAAEGGAP